MNLSDTNLLTNRAKGSLMETTPETQPGSGPQRPGPMIPELPSVHLSNKMGKMDLGLEAMPEADSVLDQPTPRMNWVDEVRKASPPLNPNATPFVLGMSASRLNPP